MYETIRDECLELVTVEIKVNHDFMQGLQIGEQRLYIPIYG